ncbi:ABC transporter permease [Paenibacillus faecalis]|uniref:ABC transporter permease n=1 Tax=Paenibacillus faecalis TaxID=2079532 RepID=UPI00131A507C|nr:ABC-2 family transporter protein [Paenibacillus faecalis]
MNYKAYFLIFKNNLYISLSYRWNIISGILLMILQIMVSLFVWLTIFDTTSNVKNYTVTDMISYFLLSALVGVTFSSSHIFRLTRMVRTGQLNMVLIRPYSFLLDSFSNFIGSKMIEFGTTILLAVTLYSVGLTTWHGISLLELLLLLTNFTLLFIFGSFLGSLSFWLIQMWPLKSLYNSMMAIFGGALYPLDLLPDKWAQLITLTPFPLFGYVNIRLLQGELHYNETLYYLILSVIWLIIFSIGYKILWVKGLKKYEGVNA